MKRFTILVFLVLFVPFAWAQTPSAVMEYFDFGVRIWDETGFEKIDIDFGEVLTSGYRIETGPGSVELKMLPQGTIIRLTPGTNFVINSIQGQDNATANDFTLNQGRIRAVVARSTNTEYRIRTSTAVGGVRGTDFGMDVIPGQKDQLFVKEGLVEFTNLETNQSLMLGAGQFADTFSELFQSINLDPGQLEELFSGLDFISLDPSEVPGQSPVESEEEAEEESETEEPADEPEESAESPDPAQTTPSVSAADVSQPDSSEPGTDQESGQPEQAENQIMNWLLEFLGVEIGSITIDGSTYGKAVFMPRFEIGKFRTQLYLPIIYTDDLFDPNKWYQPNGNNEWSFGSDQDGLLATTEDIIRDLLLKIKFIEYANNRDPFFFKLGNIESMTLGHGILINGYANDADFPSVRRLGLNLGFSGNRFKTEFLVNDLGEPEIFGIRAMWQPLAQYRGGFAISGAADINPAKDLKAAAETANQINAIQQEAATADPQFYNFAFDVDLPIIESGLLSLVTFADIGTLIPYLPTDTVEFQGETIQGGFRYDTLIHNPETRNPNFQNFGIQTGVFGNIAIVDYRLEYQYYKGGFIPNFYNQPYDRIRGERVIGVLEYLANEEAYRDIVTMGIYGSGKVNILPQVDVSLGYRWPWTITDDGINTDAEDYFHLGVSIRKGLLPMGISGELQYDRIRFRDVFTETESKLFDENAVLKGSAGFEISPGVDIFVTVGTAVVRDESGAVIYGSNNRPTYQPTVSLETRIGF